MDNVDLKVVGDVLTITVDLSRRGVRSSTGKTLLIASTHGATAIAAKREGVKVALNVMVPA